MPFNHSLARAKTQVPRFRNGLIERQRLESRLGKALLQKRLVLLVAPAGYGKTAALSRQLQLLPPESAVAWITVDEEDDLQRFLAYLIEALEPLDPPWRVAPQVLFEWAADNRLREAATALLTTLEGMSVGHGVLVLDDVHDLADPQVFTLLDHVLDGLPAAWTLVIAARLEPPLALARWRAQRETREFDEAMLGFSGEEAEVLLRSATGKDDPEYARQLLEKTGGWPAGLCLSLEASRSAAPSQPAWRNRRHLFEYLASEVFEKLPPALQNFLLRCSVLNELTIEACRRLSGDPQAAHWIEEIERRRLFVLVLDAESLTLKLHDLFRDFLEERLRRVFPAEVPSLLVRAAEGETDPVRRTLTYLRAGAWDAAQRSLASAAADMIGNDETVQVTRLVEQFPADLQANSPVLAYVRGLCAWSHDAHRLAWEEMQRAADGLDRRGWDAQAQRARAMQALAMVFCDDVDRAWELARSIRTRDMDLETRTISELVEFWYVARHGAPDAPAQRLATVVDLLLQGHSAEMWSRCMHYVQVLSGRPGVGAQMQRMIDGAKALADEGHWLLSASINLFEAWILLSQGRIAELENSLRQVEEDVRWLGQRAALRTRLLGTKALYHVIRNDEAGVRAACEAMIADRSNDVATVLQWPARAFAGIEAWGDVRKQLQATGAHPKSDSFFMQATNRRIVEAQLCLHEGRLEEAVVMFRELASRTSSFGMAVLNALVQVHLALAELESGAPDAAWRGLAPFIEQVNETGNVGHVLILGVRTLTRLADARWGEVASPQGLATLRQWADTAQRLSARPAATTADAPAAEASKLTTRELAVLALIADGQSNKLIARNLALSPHTVKRHVARILDRLDVASRMQAANWYRAHAGPSA